MAKALPLKKGTYWISAKWRYSNGRGHFAYDLATNGTGHPVYSITDGKVVACNDGVYDNYTKQVPTGPYSGKPSNWIIVQFKNRKTGKQNYVFYQHLKRGLKVKKGQRVKPGQHIGNVGLTGNTSGPHLHLAVGNHAYNGNRYSYMNNNGGGATWTPTSVRMEIKPESNLPPRVRVSDLKYKKKNVSVKRVQLALRALGPEYRKLNPGGASGYYGSETRKMVALWRKRNGSKLSTKSVNKAMAKALGFRTI